jgi:hypothetical protein
VDDSSGLSDVDEAITKMKNPGIDQAIQDGRYLFVDSLSYGATVDDVRTAFDQANLTAETVDVPQHRVTQKSYGYGLVTMTTAADAERAILELRNLRILDRKVDIKLYDRLKAPKRISKMARAVIRSLKVAKASSEEDGEINEGETNASDQVQFSAAADSKAPAGLPKPIITKAQKKEIRRAVEEMSHRVPSLTALEKFVEEGKAVLLQVAFPSGKKMKGKKKVIRTALRSAFYAHLLGDHLERLFCALEPRLPMPTDPLRLLLIFPSSEDASNLEGTLKATTFTVEEYVVAIQTQKSPGLDLGSLKHGLGGKGKKGGISAGQPVLWEGLTVIAQTIWAEGIIASAVSKGVVSQRLNDMFLLNDISARKMIDGNGAGVSHMLSQTDDGSAIAPKQHGTFPESTSLGTADPKSTASELAASFALLSSKPQPSQAANAPVMHTSADASTNGETSFTAQTHDSQGVDISATTTARSTLADLTTHERELQQRYWGLILDSDLARCPTCRLEGHMTETCPSRTCKHCHAFGKHFSSACPVAPRKCSKCGEKGHSLDACPSKLRRTDAELECDLCSKPGHMEDHCPSIWRTFDPDKIQNVRKIASLIVSCYECGSKQHWGCDCPGRPRNVTLFSEIFSAREANRYLHAAPQNGQNRKSKGISIKGRSKHDSILIDDHDDDDDDDYDPADFLHPSTQRTSARGNITMDIGKSNPLRNGNLPARPPPPSSRLYPPPENYSSHPPPQAHDRQRSRSPPRRPQNNYRDRNDAPQQRRGFPSRQSEQRGYQQGRRDGDRYQPRR